MDSLFPMPRVSITLLETSYHDWHPQQTPTPCICKRLLTQHVRGAAAVEGRADVTIIVLAFCTNKLAVNNLLSSGHSAGVVSRRS